MNKRFVMGTLSAVLLAGTVPVCEAGAAEEPSGSQVAEFSELSDDINQGNTEEVSHYGSLTLQYALSIAGGICIVWTILSIFRRYYVLRTNRIK